MYIGKEHDNYGTPLVVHVSSTEINDLIPLAQNGIQRLKRVVSLNNIKEKLSASVSVGQDKDGDYPVEVKIY